jgi:hypothetical protein
MVTVNITGHALALAAAEAGRDACDQDCDSCDGGRHVLVYRDEQPWREVS